MINNVGILHETLVTRVASLIVSNKEKTAASMLRLSKRFFAPSKALNAELRLHLSLTKSANLTEHAAVELLRSVRESASKADMKQVSEETDKATKIIGAALGEDKIMLEHSEFSKHVLAGRLIAAWRKGSSPEKIASLESDLIKKMMAPAGRQEQPTQGSTSTEILNKMMTLRMAEAYGDRLRDDHKEIIADAVRGNKVALVSKAQRLAERMNVMAAAAADLTPETKQTLRELAEKLTSAVKSDGVLDDKFIAQMMASADVEREFAQSD